MSFEANQGQADSQVQFLSRGDGYALFVTPTAGRPQPPGAPPSLRRPPVAMQLVGASASPHSVGAWTSCPGVSNYLIGNDPSQWHTNVPNYAQVEEQGVYPGVDLIYYGNQRQLEYDFTVAPGADPGVIRLAFRGRSRRRSTARATSCSETAGGAVVEQAPVLYQESGGVRQPVSGHFVLEGDGQVGFAVGTMTASLPLVIDPILSYSTYLGGSGDSMRCGLSASPWTRPATPT